MSFLAYLKPSTLLRIGRRRLSPSLERKERSFHGVKGDIRPARDVMLVALWLALVTGLIESVYWLVQKWGLGVLTFAHPGVYWIAPVAQLMLFAVPGFFLAAGAWLLKSRVIRDFAITWLAIFTWLNTLLLIVPQLDLYAYLLLACGLATVTGHFFHSHATRILRLMRRTVVWLAALVVSFAVVQQGGDWLRSYWATSALPPAPGDAPNVLLVTLDTVRADALELYGGSRPAAPWLTRFAQRGVVFEQAWTTSPWTLPAHAGMFTGRLPHEVSTDWRTGLDGAWPTLAEQLAARGWLCGGFVGNRWYCGAETGLARGFAHYEGYRLTWAEIALSTAVCRKIMQSDLFRRMGFLDRPARKSGDEVSAGFLRWLQNDRGGRPFFAFLNYIDAHDPYLPPPDLREHFPEDQAGRVRLALWWWIGKDALSAEEVEMARRNYEACIRELDRKLQRLFGELERRGELDNTLVIVASDHGEHFGEKDLFLHGNSLYEPLLRVPLLVVWPQRIPQGERIATPVSTAGLPATVMRLVSAGEESPFPGTSWSQTFQDDGEDSPQPTPVAEIETPAICPACQGRSPVFRGPMKAIRSGSLKYIRTGEDEELYDLSADPLEERNLAAEPESQAELDALRRRLSVGEPSR